MTQYSDGEERRRENINVRDIIDVKLREVESRRDKNLQAKLDSIEKLVNMTMGTRSDALTVAIARMQGDTKDCGLRCTIQVEKFYNLIHAINNDNVGRDKDIKILMEAVSTINRDLAALESHHDSDKERTERESETAFKDLEEKYITIDKWRSGFWVKNATAAIVLSVFISQILFQGFTWIIDYLSKVKPPTP